MFTPFTRKLIHSVPLAFDYAVGRHPDVDEVVARLTDEGYAVFLHYWPESDLAATPQIQHRLAAGWNSSGIGFRISDADSYDLLQPFPRRIAINLRDRFITTPDHYRPVDKVLCKHLSLAQELRRQGVWTELFSYDTVVKTVVEYLPALEEEFGGRLPDGVTAAVITRGDVARLRATLVALAGQIYPSGLEIIVVGDRAPSLAEIGPLPDGMRLSVQEVGPVGTDGTAAAMNQAVDSAPNTHLVLLEEGAIPEPWHTLTCVRLLERLGDESVLVIRERPKRRVGVHPSHGAGVSAVPSPFGFKPEDIEPIRDSRITGDTQIALHTGSIPPAFRFSEDLSGEWCATDFVRRLRKAGCEALRPTALECDRLPRQALKCAPTCGLANEVRLLQRHPALLLDGSYATALEPEDGGSVAVVVPFHARTAVRLERLLRFLKKQRYAGELRVVVSDDASHCSGELRRLCDTYEAVYVPVTRKADHLTTPHRAKARAVGAAAVESDYLLFLDQDMLISPFHVQNCVNILRFHGDNIVCQAGRCGMEALLELSDLTAYSRFHLTAERICDLLDTMFQAEPIPVRQLGGDWQNFRGHNAFLSRDMYLRVGPFDEGYIGYGVEDTDYAYRLMKCGARFVFMNHLLAYHVGHASGPEREGYPLFQQNIRRFCGKFPEAIDEYDLREWVELSR